MFLFDQPDKQKKSKTRLKQHNNLQDSFSFHELSTHKGWKVPRSLLEQKLELNASLNDTSKSKILIAPGGDIFPNNNKLKANTRRQIRNQK